MSDEVSRSDEDEMRARFFEEVLRDFTDRTDDFQLSFTPLGDGIGFRVDVHLTESGGSALFLAGASHASALAAASMAIGRGAIRLDEALESEDEDEDAER